MDIDDSRVRSLLFETEAKLISKLPHSFFSEAGVPVNSPYEAAMWWLSDDPHNFTELDYSWTAYEELYPYVLTVCDGTIYDSALANVHHAQRLMRCSPDKCSEDNIYAMNRAVDMCLNVIDRERRVGHYATANRIQVEMDASRAVYRARDEEYRQLHPSHMLLSLNQ